MSNILKFPDIKVVPDHVEIPVGDVLDAIRDDNPFEIMAFTRTQLPDGSFEIAMYNSSGGVKEILLMLEMAKFHIVKGFIGDIE